MAKIGAALRSARERAGLTLRQVGRATGLSPQQLSKLESGTPPNPGWATVSKLARVVGLSLDEVAGIKPVKAPAGVMVQKTHAKTALEKARKVIDDGLRRLDK